MEQVAQGKAAGLINPINLQGSVALYWDFENLHAGVFKQKNGEYDDYAKVCCKPQEALMDVAAILTFAETLGTVVINRAFGHWGKFQRYRVPLLEASVDLVQLFPVGANGKNGADIRLCLDVMEDMVRYPHIQTIVIAAGDSDYLPLVHKIKATGRKLYGIGGTLSTNQYWAKSCHGFTYYENLIQPHSVISALDATNAPLPILLKNADTAPLTPALPAHENSQEPATIDDALGALVVQAMLRLTRKEKIPLDGWVSKNKLRAMLKTLDTPLDEQCYGFTDFKTFIEAMRNLLETHPKKRDETRLKPSCFDAAKPDILKSMPCFIGLRLKGAPNERLIALFNYPLPCVFRQPIFNETPDFKTLGEAFIAWLKRGLAERRLAFNTGHALVQLLSGKAALNRHLVERFYMEHPELATLNPKNETHIVSWIEKALISLNLHYKNNNSPLWPCLIRTKHRKIEQFSQIPFNAFLIKAHHLFDVIPPDNPDVRIKPTPKKKQKKSTKTTNESAVALL